MVTRSKLGTVKPKRFFDLLHYQSAPNTPSSYSQAIKHSEWRQAMSQEFHALQAQGTWTLVPPPSSHPILGCRWTYRIKLHADGSIARYKARLVAQGHTQEYDINYTETFSPVAKFPTLRIFLTVAISHHWTVTQLDVSNAFLHGHLPDIVYMRQPPGFQDSTYPNHVCLLRKALYGLKQAPRQWFNTFSQHLIQFGFTVSTADTSLFIYHTPHIRVYLLIYVDDILVTGNSSTFISSLFSNLQTAFNIKILGPINQFLEIQVLHQPDGLLLSQTHYATSILHSAGMQECKAINNPLPAKTAPSPASSAPLTDPHLYRHLVGALQYLTLTRPDIQFAVNQLCQHLHAPTTEHFQLLKRLLRYLQGTLHLALPIRPTNLSLSSFSDANWASDHLDRRSTTGFCSYLGVNLVSWQVKKQPTVAKSSTEAEYRSLALAASDIIWLHRLLHDFHIASTKPTTLYCDNISTMALATNLVFHARTKHIEIDYHFIRENIQSKEIEVYHVSSVDQIADILTKALPTPRFELLRTS